MIATPQKLLPLLVCTVLFGCSLGEDFSLAEIDSRRCVEGGSCPAGQVCGSFGYCVVSDANVDLAADGDTTGDARDTAADGSDVELDADADLTQPDASELAADTASDSTMDAATDTAADLATDTAADTGIDTTADLVTDTTADLVTDTAADTSIDTAADLVTDTAADLVTDTAVDTSIDTSDDAADTTYTDTPTGMRTGFMSPSAEASDTGGDNNGFELNPTAAFADGAGYAEDEDSGTAREMTCDPVVRDRHQFFNYGFAIPAGSTIEGIEVRLDAWADANWKDPSICLELSWDGGVTWTAADSGILGTVQATVILGGEAVDWGRTWSSADFSDANFRVRTTTANDSIARDFYLDWIPVQVHFTQP